MNIKKTMTMVSALTLAASLSFSGALADSAAVTAEKSANIRSGAGMNHPVIGWAMKGDILETLGESGNWVQVEMKNGKTGYIHSSLLSIKAPEASQTLKVTAEKSANVRDKASMSGKVVGWAMHGESVIVLEKGAKWTKVELENGTVGYIHSSLLGKEAASAPSESKTAKITAEKSANVRAEAGMSGKVIGWAMKDETVTILEEGSKWLKVELESGLIGYIHHSMLSK